VVAVVDVKSNQLTKHTDNSHNRLTQ